MPSIYTYTLNSASSGSAFIGTTRTVPIIENNNRVGLTVINISGNFISLGLNASVVLYAGITLMPGATWYMDDYSYMTGPIEAIASGAG